MNKINKIIYWIATAWLSLGMISTGIVQIIHQEEEVQKMTAMGYPMYILTIIGTWKILGAVAILIPNYPLLKEWAYAGMLFDLSGAAFSRMSIGDPAQMIIIPLLIMGLVVISWISRPESKSGFSTVSKI